jgi:hypothetical protein
VPLVRLLDLALLTIAVWWVWSRVIRGWRQANDAQRAAQAAASIAAASSHTSHSAGQQEAGAMTLLPCARCGVHVPAGRTLPGRGSQVYCSDACRGRDGF